jgi:hypothetical protein
LSSYISVPNSIGESTTPNRDLQIGKNLSDLEEDLNADESEWTALPPFALTTAVKIQSARWEVSENDTLSSTAHDDSRI